MVLVVCLLCGISSSAAAQKRKVRRTAVKPSPVSSFNNPAEVKASAEKVSVQIKNLSKFIFVLGSVAQGIQDIDRDAKAGKASRATIDLNKKNKQSVVATISNLRAGLEALEDDFRNKPSLRAYLLQIEGVSQIAAIAEQQASGGQFNESGKTLLQAIEKLSDTLTAMP